VGQTYGPFDLNDDHVPDAMCGPRDFGGGLVMLRFCDAAGFAAETGEGITLVPDSLFSWPTRNEDFPMDGISGDAVIGCDEENNRLFVIVFNTDGLFETGSAEVSSPDTFTNLVARINESAPGATVQVRGHTDSTGDPASNQALSDQRAASIASFLTGAGVDATVTSIGFGETQPLALEDTDAGRQFNRRVEVVIRPAA
jgi:outer membrane protein OmpA-like peptidoglycan-associated protein